MEQRIEDYIDDNQSQASLKLPFEDEGEELKIRETKFIADEGAAGPKLCLRSIDSSRLPRRNKSSTIHINHRRLDNLLDRLTAAHRWREASGVLSLLFAGNPRSYSPTEDRKYVRIAMEIQKRFCRKGNYHNLIKSTFEIWSSKLSWYKKGNMKWRLLHLELALFYISQEKFDDAKHNTRLLVSDEVSEPFVNLIHGLILYQLWYAELPEEMQIKGFNAHSSSDAFTTPVVDGCLETEMGESSNGHDAVDIENTKVSSQHSSESSFGNNGKLKEGKNYVRRKISGDIGQCLKDEGGFLKNLDNFSNTSIYFASGSYGTTQLIEMLATHLDNVDGKSIVWEEFASCFLKLRTVTLIEDRISGNVGVATVNLHRNIFPATFRQKEKAEKLGGSVLDGGHHAISARVLASLRSEPVNVCSCSSRLPVLPISLVLTMNM
ncbi:hypothetical protein KSP40_PGU006930 [Platanthera guangdongensis]|uniref:Uncharacterized protein n=1 Tax=Platanthera guangdongensis TaxID=2320717 RepID=A0ABR2M0I4_9ASPA